MPLLCHSRIVDIAMLLRLRFAEKRIARSPTSLRRLERINLASNIEREIIKVRLSRWYHYLVFPHILAFIHINLDINLKLN